MIYDFGGREYMLNLIDTPVSCLNFIYATAKFLMQVLHWRRAMWTLHGKFHDHWLPVKVLFYSYVRGFRWVCYLLISWTLLGGCEPRGTGSINICFS
jgi:hypothetical protein